MTKHDSKQKLFDAQAEIDKAEREFFAALEKPTQEERANVIGGSTARISWIVEHRTAPPQDAVLTARQLQEGWEALTELEQVTLTSDIIVAFAPEIPRGSIEAEVKKSGKTKAEAMTFFELISFPHGIGRLLGHESGIVLEHLEENPSGPVNPRLRFKDLTCDIIVELYRIWRYWSENPGGDLPEDNLFIAKIKAAQKPPRANPLVGVIKALQNRLPKIDSTSIYDSRRPAAIMRFSAWQFYG